MPLPQPPVQTAPSFGERLLTSGTISRGVTGITQGILQGKAMRDWKRFIQAGEAGSKRLYDAIANDPQLEGIAQELPAPYFDPKNPNAYILEVARVTSDYKKRRGLATGFQKYAETMRSQNQRRQPAQQRQQLQQPAAQRQQATVPQVSQNVPALSELAGSMAQGGALEQIEPILSSFSEAISKGNETTREALKMNLEAMKTFNNLVKESGRTGGVTGEGQPEGTITPGQLLRGESTLQLEKQFRPSQFPSRGSGRLPETEEERRRKLLAVSEGRLQTALNNAGVSLREYISMSPEQRQQRFGGSAAEIDQLRALVEDDRRELEKITGREIFPKQQAGTKENPARITSDEEFNALPSGSYFMGPDGVLRGPKP